MKQATQAIRQAMRQAIRSGRRSTAFSTLVILGLMALLSTACVGRDESPIQIGLKRVALDLAFKGDEEEKKPPRQIVQEAPPVIQTDFTITPQNELVLRPVPPFEPFPVLPDECPAAGPNAVPEQPVTVAINNPPLEGTYPAHNDGKLKVTAGAFNFEGPYPLLGEVRIENVTDETSPPSALGGAGSRTIEFDRVTPVGNTTSTDRYRVTASELQLVSREIETEDGTFTFTPTPPVTIVGLGSGEGDSWTSAGTDLTTGGTMVVEGSILKRELVDLCGDVYDTYRVQSSERLIALAGDQSFVQVTDDTSNPPGEEGPGQPNFYNVATQMGGHLLRTETHRTTTAGELIVEEDNVQTLDTADPEPL